MSQSKQILDYLEEGNSNPIEKEIAIVNHGNVFGTGNWYTFHCPICSENLGSNRLSRCPRCNQFLKPGASK